MRFSCPIILMIRGSSKGQKVAAVGRGAEALHPGIGEKATGRGG